MKKLAQMKEEYEQVKDAMDAVRLKGYGVVTPKREEIHLEEPVIIKQGSKFGVKNSFRSAVYPYDPRKHRDRDCTNRRK